MLVFLLIFIFFPLLLLILTVYTMYTNGQEFFLEILQEFYDSY